MKGENLKIKAEELIKKEAKKIKLENIKEVLEKEEEIKNMFKKAGPLNRFFEDFNLLISLLRDYWNKRYREIPWWTIAAIVVALLYVLNPLDIIPDFIPVFGQIDDALVVMVCLKMIEQDLSKYKEWKMKNDIPQK